MIKRIVTNDDYEWAEIEWARWKKNGGHKSKYFFSSPEAALAGFIAERIYWNENPSHKRINTSQADFLDLDAITYDVKASRTDYVPQPTWFLQIPACDFDRRKPDRYVHGMVTRDLEVCYLFGWITRANFERKGYRRKEGESRQPHPQLKAKCDCVEIVMHELDQHFNDF